MLASAPLASKPLAALLVDDVIIPIAMINAPQWPLYVYKTEWENENFETTWENIKANKEWN